MSDIIDRLDEIEQNVMDELKDFQKVTVERIDHLYRKGQKRVLVSDEVGLGKTLIARGTIAKFANLRKEEGDDLVKVVYICSNAAIAEQNLDKLRIVNEITAERGDTSRLSMQHLNIFRQEHDRNVLNRYIQLIPLTPETSFKVSNSQGTIRERALIYAIVRRIPRLKYFRKKVERLFRFGVRYWDWAKDEYEREVLLCDIESDGEYLEYMVNAISHKFETIKYDGKTFMDCFIDFLRSMGKDDFDKRQAKRFIVKLRIMFADISLEKLDPDLIIMDEFQRFRYLLNSDENSDMDRLTKKFFNSDEVRILMLSATPYKMYSTLDEIDEDNIDAHYSEFFDVVNFLNKCPKEQEKFKDIWNNYSIKLKEFNRDKNSFLVAKKDAENAMFKNICRTERITENHLADIINDSDAKVSLKVFNQDIESFIEAQKLLDEIGFNSNVPVDYIKSTPYIMSFMKHYQLKRRIERYFKKHPDEINLMAKDTFWLKKEDIDNYKKISTNNARLDNLMGHVLKDNASNLLWIPPSKPYYELNGAFKNTEDFTKTLIFSSWEMVPRMISSMVSYEVERQTIGRLSREVSYFAERRYPSPRMRFALKEDEPTQMSLFTLIYPSIFLINTYNPIECLNRKLTLSEIENKLKSDIKMKLNELPEGTSTREDLRWYHLAPLLMDDREFVETWFKESEKLIESGYFYRKGYLKHYYKLKEQYYEFYQNTEKLGRKPADLIDVLCDMAIAAPGVCAYRAYEKELPDGVSMIDYNIAPTQIARKFIDRMNLPESISVIDLNFKSNSEEAYWKNVLKYSKDGNLQAVFDEYVHLLSNGLDKNNVDRIDIINNKFLTSFEFRTTSYDIDTFKTFKKRMLSDDKTTPSLRTHFAASFTKGRSDVSDTNRKKSVRDAFNSPFRPFVLASTSIGQEGLDFHNYCRRIVHWNLPANPIDLEQREGRINRFECLAIRQNIAKRYSGSTFKSNDIWAELFKKACENESDESSDLIPYWGLSEKENMVKIERIVPMYPFSRDEIKYDRLIKILSLYRLTLGQARQEELLESLFDKFDFKDDIDELFINLSPYYKRDVEDFEIECEEVEHVETPKIEYRRDNEPNLIFEQCEKYGFPVESHICSRITNDFELMSNLNNDSNLDSRSYYNNLIERLDFKLFKWNFNCYMFLISDVLPNLARIETVVENGYLEVKLHHANIEKGEGLFDWLYSLKNEIEEELGFELYWNNRLRGHIWEISIFVPIDMSNTDNWPDAINWHLFMAKRFDEVFGDRIRNYFNDNPLRFDNRIRTQYWLELTKRLSKTSLVNYDVPHLHQWFCMFLDDSSIQDCHLEFHAYTHIKQIKTTLIIEKSRKNLYNYLKKDKQAIEKELGFELKWVKLQGRRHIRATYPIDIKDKNNWDEAMKWHISIGEKFKEVFYPRIKEFYRNL